MRARWAIRLLVILLFLFGLYYQYLIIFQKSYPQVVKQTCSESRFLKPFPLVYPISIVRNYWLAGPNLVGLDVMVGNPKGSVGQVIVEILEVSDPKSHRLLHRAQIDLRTVKKIGFRSLLFDPPLELQGRKISLVVTTDETNPDLAPQVVLAPDTCDPDLNPDLIEKWARDPAVRFYTGRHVSEAVFRAMDEGGTVFIPFVKWYLIGVNLLFLAFLAALERFLSGERRMFRPALAVLCLLFLVKSLAVIRLTPPWIRIDEPIHFEYCHYISEGLTPTEIATSIHKNILYWAFQSRFYKSLIKNRYFQIQGVEPPKDPDEVSTDSLSNGNYYSRFSLAHYLAGKTLSLFRTGDLDQALYRARVFSLLFYVALLPIYMWIDRHLFPNGRSYRVFGLALLVYLPSFGQSLSGYSNDGMMMVIGFLYFLTCWRILSEADPFPAGPILLTFALVGLGVATDEVGYVLLPAQWIFINLVLYSRRLDKRWYRGFNAFMGGMAVLFLIFSPFLRGLILDHVRFIWAHLPEYSFKQVLIFIAYIVMSSLGVFVWGHLFYPNWLYHLYSLFLLVALVGGGVRLVRQKGAPLREAKNLFMIAYPFCFVAAMVFQYFSASFLPYLWIHAHARFLFPAFCAFLPMITYGWSLALKRDLVLYLLLFAIQFLDWYTVYETLIPAYYILPANV